MQVHTYVTGRAFLADVQAELERNEAANSLMLGLALNLEDYELSKPPYMAAVTEGGRCLLAALMTPPHNVVLAGNATRRQPLELLIDTLLEGEVDVPGTVAPCELAEGFVNVWQRYRECTVEPNMSMRVYRADSVCQPSGVGGRLRPASEHELEQLARWRRRFQEETGLPVQDEEECRTQMEKLVAADKLYLWEYRGRAVSMAAATRETRNGIAINLVYTPPEYRRRGYASACVAALTQKMLGEGREFCSLFADLANPESNSIYRRIGYKPVCDFREYSFG